MLYNFNRILEGTTQALTTTGTSTSTATAFGSQTRAIMINANTAIHFAIATAPVATSAGANPSPFLPANETNFFNVAPGQKIAVVKAASNGLVTSTDGTTFITEVE